MEKKFEIILPEIHISSQERENQIKAILKGDFEKGGNLAKVLVFLYLSEPEAVTALSNKLSEYYQIEFERTNVFRALQRLLKNGCLFSTTTGYVISLDPSERKEVHNKILQKHQIFLSKMPKQFQGKYTDVNYFWLSNGYGINVLEWCCRLLNFKIKEKKSITN